MSTRWDRLDREEYEAVRARLDKVLNSSATRDESLAEMEAEEQALDAADPGIWERLEERPVRYLDLGSEMPFEPGALAAAGAWLDGRLPGKRPGPWTRLTCDIGGRTHDTGAEARLQRHPQVIWGIGIRQNRTPITGIEPAHPSSATPGPNRLQIECAGCGHPTRRIREFLAPALMRALVEYQDALAHGDNMVPRVSWTPRP